MARLKLGLLVNPLAGLGGTVGLKGSDGVADLALSLGARSRVAQRVTLFLEGLNLANPAAARQMDWLAAPGVMGADYLQPFHHASIKVLNDESASIQAGSTTAADTERCCRLMLAENLDLLVFAGGDGTARNLVNVLRDAPSPQVVLGIPCGVKMHSATFATSPVSASLLLQKLLAGELLSVIAAEVRDLDEESLRQGQVKSRHYGELLVPEDLRYLQQTKVAGLESDELVMEEIAADLREQMQGRVCLMGAGTTIAAIMESLGIDNTLLGVDAIRDGHLLGTDLAEAEILQLIRGEPAMIVMSFTGGQGYLFGRGNQQLSAEVIRLVGAEQLWVLATKSKLKALQGRPLLVDTGDRSLDEQLSGLIRIRTGYADEVLYLVEAA